MPASFLLIAIAGAGLSAFSEQLLRYLVSAAAVSIALASLAPLRAQRIQARAASQRERRRDLRASIQAAAVFAGVALLVGYAQRRGWTRIYADPRAKGLVYLAASFPLLLVVHDAYFYWTHRLLHWRPLFERLHARHHESATPTVWTAAAFHWGESLIQSGIYPLIAFLIPVHFVVLASFLVYAALHSALIHSGHDLLLQRRRARVFFYAAWAHDHHHLRGRGDYALYFSWWDRWMGTQASPLLLPAPQGSRLSRRTLAGLALAASLAVTLVCLRGEALPAPAVRVRPSTSVHAPPVPTLASVVRFARRTLVERPLRDLSWMAALDFLAVGTLSLAACLRVRASQSHASLTHNVEGS